MPIKGDTLQRGPEEAELRVVLLESFQQVHFLPKGSFDLGIVLSLLLYQVQENILVSLRGRTVNRLQITLATHNFHYLYFLSSDECFFKNKQTKN